MNDFNILDENSIQNFLNDDLLSENAGITQENPDNDVLLMEAVLNANLTSDELEALSEDSKELAILQDENILQEKSIIKFDKNAKLKRLESQSIIVIAREKRDRDLNKLLRVWKMRRILLDRLKKKYINQARARARQILRTMSHSKSNSAKKAASRTK